MNFIKKAEWRYATKKFDKNKKVSQHEIEQLKKSIQLAPSSYGLQPYKVIIIRNQDLKEKLKSASFEQPQITDCSHLFVFCNFIDVDSAYVDEFLELNYRIQKKALSGLIDYGTRIKSSISKKSKNEKEAWIKNQTYLALGNLLSACSDFKIDACPMEGFEHLEYNRILNLNKKGLNACVIATIGFRDSEDKTQYQPKVRKPEELLFEEV